MISLCVCVPARNHMKHNLYEVGKKISMVTACGSGRFCTFNYGGHEQTPLNRD